MDQPEHVDFRAETQTRLRWALEKVGVKPLHIYTLHKEFDLAHAGWTYIPIFQELLDLPFSKPLWYVFLHEAGRIDGPMLQGLLDKYDSSQSILIGRALADKRMTIVHRFHSNLDFKFPDPSAGIIMSHTLLTDMTKHLEKNEFNIRGLPQGVSIDAEFELAQAIYYRHVDDSKETPILMTHDNQLCSKPGANCAIWSNRLEGQALDCKIEVSTTENMVAILKRVSFAVKTCSRFHKERLPKLIKTWAKATINLDLVSEVKSREYGTKVLPGVTKNTETGHCMKTAAIMKDFHDKAEAQGLDWLVVTDDDTVLSVAKIAKLLNCYDPKNPVVIGQRYGYKVNTGLRGYDYPAGGAGMLFSRTAVAKIINGGEACKCPRPDTEDDLHIGGCMTSLGIPLIHSEQLHHARPQDYPSELIKDQDPISFHSWGLDPKDIYEKWFLAHDRELIDLLGKTPKMQTVVVENTTVSADKDEL